MAKHLKTLESVLASLIVKSLTNGNMLIEIKYKGQQVEDGATGMGIITRLEIAEEIGKLLYEHIGKIRYKRKTPNVK